MTGPEHYREAEALARTSLNWMGGEWGPEDMTRAERLARKDSDVAMAQVHATLALAATQVDGAAVMRPADRHEWLKAIDPDYAAGQASEAAL